jgi:hypothetical protein
LNGISFCAVSTVDHLQMNQNKWNNPACGWLRHAS